VNAGVSDVAGHFVEALDIIAGLLVAPELVDKARLERMRAWLVRSGRHPRHVGSNVVRRNWIRIPLGVVAALLLYRVGLVNRLAVEAYRGEEDAGMRPLVVLRALTALALLVLIVLLGFVLWTLLGVAGRIAREQELSKTMLIVGIGVFLIARAVAIVMVAT
jgi:hypothetical protein